MYPRYLRQIVRYSPNDKENSYIFGYNIEEDGQKLKARQQGRSKARSRTPLMSKAKKRNAYKLEIDQRSLKRSRTPLKNNKNRRTKGIYDRSRSPMISKNGKRERDIAQDSQNSVKLSKE